MEMMKRTATCGELRREDTGRRVILNGWVHRNRDHGGIHFINLRDRYGTMQIVIDQDASEILKHLAEQVKFEYCIAVEGIVRERPDSMKNEQMATGDIELSAAKIEILSTCKTLPFMIDKESDAKEDLRLEYRFLDLRSEGMQKRIKLRHDFTFSVREFLSDEGFLEIETPTLIKSTPEGARDFLVPSRTQPGKFYALPQSPQLFKQILMVSGFDKYFQIARCYRDEDARGDRQLEFTQIDIEMSFVSKEDIFKITERMFDQVFAKVVGVELPAAFRRITYEDSMNTYGSDKPDLRFDMPIRPFDSFAEESSFNTFKHIIAEGGCVKALVAPGCAHYSRKGITQLEETAKIYKAKGLAWMKVTAGSFEGGVSKFFNDAFDQITEALGTVPGDLILMVADSWIVTCNALGAVRNKLGHDLELVDPHRFEFCWIIDFPLFEYNEEEGRWAAAHHMFSMPQAQYIDTMEEDPGKVKGELYDLVLNGYEVASGSIRIHDPELQRRIFKIVGFSEEDAEKRFGFLLNAFSYGAPPHGGIAPGLDRLLMIISGQTSIKEVIAFPKNSAGISPMDDSPSAVDENQLKELNLALDLQKNKG